ncbi:hypothetical protein KIPB_002750, partial [Kipferlia bialata]
TDYSLKVEGDPKLSLSAASFVVASTAASLPSTSIPTLTVDTISSDSASIAVGKDLSVPNTFSVDSEGGASLSITGSGVEIDAPNGLKVSSLSSDSDIAISSDVTLSDPLYAEGGVTGAVTGGPLSLRPYHTTGSSVDMDLAFDGTTLSMSVPGTPLSIEASSLTVSAGVSCPTLTVTSRISATSDALALSVGAVDDVLTLSPDTCTVAGSIAATGGISAASIDAASIGTTGLLSIGSTGTTGVSVSKPLTVTGGVTATSLGVTNQYVLPCTDGEDGEVLTSDGAGSLSWAKPLTGATVSAPASGAIQKGDPVVVTSDGNLESVYFPVRQGDPLSLEASLYEYSWRSMATDGNGVTLLCYQEDTGEQYAVIISQDRSTLTKGSRVKLGTDGATNGAAVTYDAAHDRFVISYYVSEVGKVVVATVSDGLSLSLGTEVTFASTSNPECRGKQSIVYDSVAAAVVIGFCGGYDTTSQSYVPPLRAVVGTVNPVDNSISIGTELTLNDVNIYGRVGFGFFYDAVADTVVALYVDYDTKSFLGRLMTVDGTTITASEAVNYAPFDDSVMFPEMCYDTVHDRIIMTYESSTDPLGIWPATNQVMVRVARIDGSTLTLGDEVAVNTGSSYTYPRIAYDARGGYAVVVYGDPNNTGATTAITATVSGESLDTVTLGTPVELAAAASDNYASIMYLPDSKSMIVSYKDTTDSNAGRAMVYAPSAQNNLDSSVYVGIAREGYADGETAVASTFGSTSDGHSGLETGRRYYVQYDGSLSTNPDSKEVQAGVAMSPTEMLVLP